MAPFPIIDNHCHYQLTEGFLDQMLEQGQAAGVSHFCLNGGGPRWRQHDNNDVLTAAEAHPGTIVPVAFCNLGEDTAAQVYAWYRAGFRALKTQCPTANYDDEAFFPVYAAAEECRMPILFHCGISARFPNHDHWNSSSRYMMPLTLDRIARVFPTLTIWAAHLGVPDTWHAAMLTRVHPHVHFDLCGIDVSGKRWSTICSFGEMFYGGENHFGKLVFGSEGSPEGFAPLIDAYRNMLDENNVPEEVQRRISWTNVAEALGLE
ncbi:MAG: amidohydrolase family protein [Armatimonadia bacterium]